MAGFAQPQPGSTVPAGSLYGIRQSQGSGALPNTVMGGIMADPMFHMGMGILGAGGNYGSFGKQLGQGSMAGILSYQNTLKLQQEQQANQLKMQQAQLAAQAAARQRQYMQQAIAELPEDQRALAQAFPEKWAEQRFRKPSASWDDYQRAVNEQGYTGSFLDFKSAIARAGATTIHMPSATEKAAAGKLTRLSQAQKEIDALEESGLDRLTIWDTIVTHAAPTVVQSLLRTNQGNQLVSAQNTWIQTFGRDESGAAIPPTEWASWRQDYFPQPGDPDEAVEAKARARSAVEEAMRIKAGRAEGAAEAAQEGIGVPPVSPVQPQQTPLDSLVAPQPEWQTTPDGVRYRIVRP